MNAKTISAIAIILWIGTAIFGGLKFVKGNTETLEDGREAVILTASEKTQILSEMRQMLQAVQGILDGIEKKDTKVISESALGGGTQMMLDVNPQLMMKLPLAFKKRGIGVHKYFDIIAKEAKGGAKSDKIISMLNKQLQSCVVCHAGYQLLTQKNGN